MKKLKPFVLLILFLGFQNVSAQHSKYVHHLVDSLPKGRPVLVKFNLEKGFMATERIAISKNGKSIYYGARNGYDQGISKAHILKIEFNNHVWSKPQIIFADSSGAPAFSRNEKVLYFQYEDSIAPRGLYSKKIKTGWSTPKLFSKSLKKVHYLQSPKKNSYYFSAGIKGNHKIQDIFHSTTTKSDTITKPLGFNIKGDWIDFYVSSNESYLVLLINKKQNTKVHQFFGNSDLFISFKTKAGTWSVPVNMGKEVNSVSSWNWAPYVTKDKKYLFFSSWGETVGTYMIDFETIYNRLKPTSN